jgi:hypothetical protein
VHGEAGEVEFIADPAESPDDWFVKDQGGGIVVLELKGIRTDLHQQT